jgi:Flp pilus assembly protein TadG
LAVLIVLSAAALSAAACGDSEPTTSASVATVQETATSAAPSTVPATGPATSEQPTDTAPTDTVTTTETTAASEAPVVELGNADNGHEVVLNPGDRVRITLNPYVNDFVKSVRWNYVPIVVQETDSGSEIISEVVVEAWLELEASILGPVTVRAEYEYPHGTVRTAWVVYLIVEEPEEEEDADGK